MGSKVTIAVLARELGISESAVSKALNDYPDISPATKKLVHSKADELGYSPNMMARNLAKKSSNLVGFVIHDMSSVYGEMFKTLNTVARSQGLQLILCDTNNDPVIEAECIRNLIDMMAMGIVVVPVSESIDRIQRITRNRVPVVYLGDKVRDASVNYVGTDSEAGAELAMRYLIGQGHRRIAMLCDRGTSASQNDKVRVYQELMRSIWQREQVFYSDAPECELAEAGYRLGKRLLESRTECTALIASRDILAIGAMGALKEAGVRVPGQVAVLGYDGIDASSLPAIRLTTMAQPRLKMAETIMDILRRQGEDPSAAPEHVLIKPELVVRNSTLMR